MEKPDQNLFLAEMYEDDYYPKLLVDKIKAQIERVAGFLEQGECGLSEIKRKFDEMTMGINGLQEEFEGHESEIDAMARDSIEKTVSYIIECFNLDIDVEDAIAERDF